MICDCIETPQITDFQSVSWRLHHHRNPIWSTSNHSLKFRPIAFSNIEWIVSARHSTIFDAQSLFNQKRSISLKKHTQNACIDTIWCTHFDAPQNIIVIIIIIICAMQQHHRSIYLWQNAEHLFPFDHRSCSNHHDRSEKHRKT